MIRGAGDLVDAGGAGLVIQMADLTIGVLTAAATIAAVWVAVAVATRDARERRAVQASQISVWNDRRGDRPMSDPDRLVVVSNGSTSTIYDVVVTWGAFDGSGQAEGYGAAGADGHGLAMKVPPGEWYVKAPLFPGDEQGGRPDLAIAFVDGAGRSWLRDAQGALRELRAKPAAHYGIATPVTWGPISRAAPLQHP